jgi:hypothetical protein
MWQPKMKDFQKYFGKPARIYTKDTEQYIEGKLIEIVKTKDNIIRYSVQVCVNNIETLYYTAVSDIITRVCVEEPMVHDSIRESCHERLVGDLQNIISEYAEPFVEI